MTNRPFRVRDLMINVVPEDPEAQALCQNVISICGNGITFVGCQNIITRFCNTFLTRPFCNTFLTRPFCNTFLTRICPDFNTIVGCGSPVTFNVCPDFNTIVGCGSPVTFNVCPDFNTVGGCGSPITFLDSTIACGPVDPTLIENRGVINATAGVNVGVGGGTLGQQNLTVLKSQLQRALQNVEAQERVMQEQMRPQSEAEVDALMQRMETALEELRSLRANMQQQRSGGEQSSGEGR